MDADFTPSTQPVILDFQPSDKTSHSPLQYSQANPAFSLWLDCFRWVAALAVLLQHANARFMVGIADAGPAQRTIPLLLFALAASFGHQAVMIFFVLSGYLVGGGLWREVKLYGVFDLKRYLFKRVSRLCIVLYPALLLIALVNLLGVYVFHGLTSGIYPADTLQTMRTTGLACNATFLQTALCAPYGHDVALWSLFNEFWYYLVWPPLLLGLLVASRWKRALFLTLACTVLATLTVLQSADSPVGPYMIIWLLGVGVSRCSQPVLPSYTVTITLLIAAASAARVSAAHHPVGTRHAIIRFALDFLLSALFANLLLLMKHDRFLSPPWGRNCNRTLAGFSFSLYCIHLPLLNAYAAACRYFDGDKHDGIPNPLWKWGTVFGALVLCTVLGFLFSRLTEANTGQVRSALKRLGLLAIRKLRFTAGLA